MGSGERCWIERSNDAETLRDRCFFLICAGLSPRMRVCVPAAAVLTLVGVMVTVLVVALNSKLPAAVGTCDNGVFHIGMR